MVVFAVFQENVAVGLQLAGPIRNALKSAPPKTRRRRFVRFVEGLMTQE